MSEYWEAHFWAEGDPASMCCLSPPHLALQLSERQLDPSYYGEDYVMPLNVQPAALEYNAQHGLYLTAQPIDKSSTTTSSPTSGLYQFSMPLSTYDGLDTESLAYSPVSDYDQSQMVCYSKRRAKRKAVFVGINYFKLCGQLRGCVNDTRNMATYLIGHFGFKLNNLVILTDDQYNPKSLPTKENILLAMHWLVKDAQPGDDLFFFYSGHGGPELYSDEDDSYDEVIYPIDFRENGHIEQDEIYRIMIWPLAHGVQLTTIFDSRWKHDFSTRHY